MGETLQSLGIQWPKLIAQTINFAIVMFVLWKWAYKPVLAVLERRREKIAESMTNADRIKQELASAQARSEEILTQAGQQANKMIEEARTAAAMVGEQERQKAIADAQQILAKAREAGDAELARLKGELRKEFGRLVVQAAARSTGDILTSDQQSSLAQDAAKQLAA